MPDRNSSSAIILIEYAKSKSLGSAPYPNVPVHVQTDAHGHFTIQSLDADWRYSGYVIAFGCKLHQFLDVDPAAGPLNISLETAHHTNAAPGTVLRGRVIDLNGQPVPGALIHMQEVTRNDTRYFQPIEIDCYSICDDAGNFTVYAKTPFTDAGGAAEAPGFSTGLFERWTPMGASNANNVPGFTTGLSNHWTPNDADHELALVEGASLQGRLVYAGKPVPNAEVCLDHFGAESGSWIWNYSTRPDDQGRFFFSHLPVNRNCRLRGLTGVLANGGLLPVKSVQVYGDGSTDDIGDVNLRAAFNVDGRITLSDRKAIPANSFVYFGDFGVGMSPSFAVAADGSFHLTGSAAGTLTLYLRIPGYELTPRDRLLISGSATNITVANDITNWVIRMKPSIPHRATL